MNRFLFRIIIVSDPRRFQHDKMENPTHLHALTRALELTLLVDELFLNIFSWAGVSRV